MQPDLHTHTTSSDGELTPRGLLQRAMRNGVQQLSITDHDTVAAYKVIDSGDLDDLDIIPGIEFSTTWNGRGIHILGHNIDPNNATLISGIASQQQGRIERAEKIARRLKSTQIPNLLEQAFGMAGDGSIGRPHFAAVLVENGVVSTRKEAFSKYLGNGKRGDVRQFWADMKSVIDWILEAGGTATLAHPGHYKLTNTKLSQLVSAFKQCGGQGIEVCNGVQTPQATEKLARLCVDQKLHASCGSDFHYGDETWSQPGRSTPLPEQCRPIWELW